MGDRPLDFDACTSYFGGDHAVMLAALEQMLDILPKDCLAMQRDIDAGQYHSAAIVAHRLAGTLDMVGATALSNECRLLSRHLDTSEIVARRTLVQVEAGIMEVMAQIHSYLHRH